MNEIITTIMSRRTIRRYSQEQISPEELEIIVNAGLYAPNAGSRQSGLIVACQNATINSDLGAINKQAFGNIRPGMSVSKDQPSIIDDPENIKSGFYGAPTVLILFAPKDFIYSISDCSVMAENIMLAAHSLGIGSCMVMRAEDTFASEKGKKLQEEWGIDSTLEAKAFVLLGYPSSVLPPAKARKQNRFIKVV